MKKEDFVLKGGKAVTLEGAVEVLRRNVERAKGNPTIRDPVCWALYHTWRQADAEKDRKEREKIRLTQYDKEA